jgi:hypothetical protein
VQTTVYEAMDSAAAAEEVRKIVAANLARH